MYDACVLGIGVWFFLCTKYICVSVHVCRCICVRIDDHCYLLHISCCTDPLVTIVSSM